MDPRPSFTFVGKFRDLRRRENAQIFYVGDNGGIDAPSLHTRTVACPVDAHFLGSVDINMQGSFGWFIGSHTQIFRS